jgi:hypothetical protein
MLDGQAGAPDEEDVLDDEVPDVEDDVLVLEEELVDEVDDDTSPDEDDHAAICAGDGGAFSASHAVSSSPTHPAAPINTSTPASFMPGR